jgi:hypothetical protein
MQKCSAKLENDLLILENNRIRRQYAWNNGHLISRTITDKASGHTWHLACSRPDCEFPGCGDDPVDGSLIVRERAATPSKPAHLQAEVSTRLGTLEVRRVFRLYPDCPAIACDLYLRGALDGVENQHAVMERLCLPTPHLRLDCVQFFDATDNHNNLLSERSILPYLSESHLSGNLLLVQELLGDKGLFILKEAPCSDAQLAWPGHDFTCQIGEIKLVGVGIEPRDLRKDEWTRGYGFVTGVAGGGKYGLLAALRSYQNQVRVHKSGRDQMIMLNTWGDRGQDAKISEAFALAEVEAAARLGITHFQLDDGWQAGQSSNSAFAGGSLENIWDRTDYWTPHPQRFPRGLGPIVERSRELGIELCLWFNPSKDNSYENWQKDADVLIALHREYGIRTFKTDGVVIADKRADENLRALFERVMEATEYEAVFNLDVTAGRRWGYHYGNEYGNIFLENRYSDWRNYYPHWTLRNLWMLSRYVPPQNLQIEFLNKWRNADNYPDDDPLAPHRLPFDYCFAITMMAQPLAWFEATGLPEQAFAIAPLLQSYRQHQEDIHAGQIFPIGEEPSGASWTGFQSVRGERGYLLVYREWNQRPRAALKLWGLVGRTVQCRLIAGHGADFTDTVDRDGCMTFHLSEPLSFALYEYR